MAGIKQPITDVLIRLRTIPITNGDGNLATPYVRVWNNQVAYLKDGKMQAWPMPAFFLEVVNNATYEILGQGLRNADLSFRVHIVHEFYDAQDGTFEQDLAVFDLRDKVIAYMTGYEARACGPLVCMSETQDYEHDNVYHYICDFVCNFTDSIGSRYDSGHPEAYTDSEPPTDLEINKTIEQGPGMTNKFIINQ